MTNPSRKEGAPAMAEEEEEGREEEEEARARRREEEEATMVEEAEVVAVEEGTDPLVGDKSPHGRSPTYSLSSSLNYLGLRVTRK